MTFSPLTTPQAQVTEGISSSAFEITALASIPSDNAAHKVWLCVNTLCVLQEFAACSVAGQALPNDNKVSFVNELVHILWIM